LRWTGIGWGDYWVLYLSPDYRVAIVGEPSREYLWILARTPTLPDTEYEALMAKVRAAGYDPDRLRRAAPR
jgi:apolipoprotein D and lipocalin family protein